MEHIPHTDPAGVVWTRRKGRIGNEGPSEEIAADQRFIFMVAIFRPLVHFGQGPTVFFQRIGVGTIPPMVTPIHQRKRPQARVTSDRAA